MTNEKQQMQAGAIYKVGHPGHPHTLPFSLIILSHHR